MKLKNRFDNADKMRIWSDHQYCAICKSNQNCSLHHIDGTSSSSIYNSVMLCHNHHKEADGHNTDSLLSKEFRKGLRQYTFNLIAKQGYTNTKNDEIYLITYGSNLT